MSIRKVLLAYDDSMAGTDLRETLIAAGFEVRQAKGGEEAIALFSRLPFAAVLLDMAMPGMDGLAVMSRLKQTHPDVPVLILAAHPDVPTAVLAIKEGAYDFLIKPVGTDHLVTTLKGAIKKTELERQVTALHPAADGSLESILGKSPAMKHLINRIRPVAESDFSIVIDGETGTGKSFIAKLIHSLSKRSRHPFVVVDMGIIPDNLVESELFGYERGAFTGADRSRKGFFELAGGGTLLIDELENMSAHIQSRLLGAVEEKSIKPLGGNGQIDVNVRIIGATNADLKRAVRERRFRDDLYYRLNEFAITLPPLRERKEDIPFLAHGFLTRASIELNRPVREMSDEALQLLTDHRWPGNVRELKNVVRKALLFSEGGVIRGRHIEVTKEYPPNPEPTGPHRSARDMILPLKEVVSKVINEAERQAVQKALCVAGGNKSKAATLLKIDYKTLLAKIKEHSIEPPKRDSALLNLR